MKQSKKKKILVGKREKKDSPKNRQRKQEMATQQLQSELGEQKPYLQIKPKINK